MRELTRLPAVSLRATFGSNVDLSALSGRTVLYVYPRTGRPGTEAPEGWDVIPGARGCTPEACAFRDHFAELRAAGVTRVFGVSTQDSDYQSEAVERLSLPFALLSDPGLLLADALDLPTFVAGAETFYRRLTIVANGSTIERVFFPVDDPQNHASQIVEWLGSRE
ncbi:peroxiredoxin [Glaciihabitans sp. INWT7]|uniref:peroxiredoxin n=1 Tax=Glaciihabitans sp. INWT7 TaxID=2596912 RepID=UPI0016260B15|nr:peroxiredoxin [Glaciihabitans sp. INWT7]QNE46369.1 peroxiredoxin [Glaciihabitans sp. INWT7]